MKVRLVALPLALVLGLVGTQVPSLAAPPAQSYTVDKFHSSANFRVKYMGVSYTYGRFDEIAGKLVVDDADPSKSSVEIELKVESVDTNAPDRDKHLRSPDFFNAKEFPTIRSRARRSRARPRPST